MIYSLSDCRWKVKGYYPWVPLKDRSMETGKELLGITDWIEARVPGGVHYDLYRAGLISYPYKDMDSLKCEWVENRWWLYKTTVRTEGLTGSRHTLVFKGIDDRSLIYINGREYCRHEGMYEPVVLDISEEVAKGKDLEIKVLLMHAADEMGQIGMTSQTHTQKSRFNYKWDFSTRLVNLGIWDDCYIKCEEEAAWETPYIYTDYIDGKGYVYFSAKIKRRDEGNGTYEAVAAIENDKTNMRQILPVAGNQVCGRFVIEDPSLWYPNGYGSQELYRVSLELKKKEKVLDSYETMAGIRSITYKRNEESPEGALPYTFCINGTDIYIKGVNLTPLDHIYGNVTEQHYEHIVRMMKNMNVNMVRVWGGGIIEKDVFYKLCDQYGIMIWQEFIQSSSGLDNVPSKKPEFLELLGRTARAAILSRRNYTSLTVWSGGNELTDEDYIPAGYRDKNIAMLKELVGTLDPQRIFFPTSASGPNEFINMDKGVSHDIHGNWNYMGNPEHYELYGQTDSLFHSEFGTEGMCSVRSLNRFLSGEYQMISAAKDNMVYRHHGEWWCTYERDSKLFGVRSNMEQLVKCSQWIQAEGLRYILEANRRRKFHNSGSIIWQLNEPWPNVFCTSLTDYYLEPKMAYYWGKTAFSDLAVSLAYRKLDYEPGEAFRGQIYVGKETREKIMDYFLKCEVMDLQGKMIFEKELKGTADFARTVKACELEFPLPEKMQDMFAVRLKVLMGKMQAENIYFFSCGCEKPYEQALKLDKSELAVQILESGYGQMKVQLNNRGKVPLLHIYPYCENGFDLLCDKSYITLFPGEEAQINIEYTKGFESGFLNNRMDGDKEEPDIQFGGFNL